MVSYILISIPFLSYSSCFVRFNYCTRLSTHDISNFIFPYLNLWFSVNSHAATFPYSLIPYSRYTTPTPHKSSDRLKNSVINCHVFPRLSMVSASFEPPSGCSALHVATLKGSQQLVGTLLDMGADINDQVTDSFELSPNPKHQFFLQRPHITSNFILRRRESDQNIIHKKRKNYLCSTRNELSRWLLKTCEPLGRDLLALLRITRDCKKSVQDRLSGSDIYLINL